MDPPPPPDTDNEPSPMSVSSSAKAAEGRGGGGDVRSPSGMSMSSERERERRGSTILERRQGVGLSLSQQGQGSTQSQPQQNQTQGQGQGQASTQTQNQPQNPNQQNQPPFLLTPDIARASLMQLSELSRRAEGAGAGGAGSGFNLNFGEGFEGGLRAASSAASPSTTTAEAEAEGEGIERPSSRIWAGLFGGGFVGGFSGMGFGFGGSGSGSGSAGGSGSGATREGEEGTRTRTGDEWGAGNSAEGVQEHEGLQVYTVGHLMPRSESAGAGRSAGGGSASGSGSWSFDSSALGGGGMLGGLGIVGGGGGSDGDAQQSQSYTSARTASSTTAFDASGDNEVVQPSPMSPPSASSSSSASNTQKLRVRRSTFVPGWAVPPRVLLVDDDAVSRKLSSKFLQVFGCTIDVAVDGVGAVNKMNLEKYDLVLMDIVMPKLDGVSATSLIRKFDHMTPIISMTSNSKPNEIMTYYSSGMNDILPKPFTKEGLLDMLEKHLMHLKVIQQMSRGVPRSVGIPPLSDSSFEQAFTSQAQAALTAGPSDSGSSSSALMPFSAPSPAFGFEDDGRINPLAGMGLTDEQYNMILQNLVNGENFMGSMGSLGSAGGGAMGMDTFASSSSGAGPSSSSSGTAGREKRPLDDSTDGRDGKRSRFEVVE
ncbi:Transcription factor SKN7 [Hypsizygus marmoreus]|uniref:Transcription factor SKN7 n=1 Tax=Hypsizygus marmoreus TaxID=39966 RepID=A0A369JM44_HYPMA|nr:Transcription factor SKN7 [Hypsizygus marmoreus]